jgi:2Fe-2S ferredoxin
MPKITVLPHEELCPQGKEFETPAGVSLADALLDHGVDIEHACGKVAACTTCHCIVRKGFESLPQAEDKEEDLLDRAWGLTPVSRLSCQAIVQNTDLTVEIPKYSINYAKEGEAHR